MRISIYDYFLSAAALSSFFPPNRARGTAAGRRRRGVTLVTPGPDGLSGLRFQRSTETEPASIKPNQTDLNLRSDISDFRIGERVRRKSNWIKPFAGRGGSWSFADKCVPKLSRPFSCSHLSRTPPPRARPFSCLPLSRAPPPRSFGTRAKTAMRVTRVTRIASGGMNQAGSNQLDASGEHPSGLRGGMAAPGELVALTADAGELL
jgi:hypothetical protein